MASATNISEVSIEDRIQKLFTSQQGYKFKIRQTSSSERIEKLKRIKVWIFDHQVQIHEALYKDFRKPGSEVDNSEIFPVKAEIEHAISFLHTWMKPKTVCTPVTLLGSSSYIMYQSKGLALIMAPWNFPFNLVLCPLVSAIAAGCCAIVKPSEITPYTSALLAIMLGELFDENEVAVIEGDSRVANALLKLPFDHIFFTGSSATGKVVMKAAAENLTSVTLELGGKSPVIIDETADVADAAEKIAWGKFINCGQLCVAPDYLFIHKSKEKAFISSLREAIERLFKGNSNNISTSTDYARIVNDRHQTRVHQLLEDAIEQGAHVVIGGEVKSGENYIAPTILTQVNQQMQVMKEEIFGPLLPVMSYETLTEVIAFINSKDNPLAFYIFSQNKTVIDEILRNTASGGVCINDCVVHFVNPYLPFGGLNNSGIGKSHGYYGFLAFSNERAVLKQRIGYTSLKMLHPPYTQKVKKLINFALKWL